MRVVLVLLGLVCLALVAMMQWGYVNFDQTRAGVVQAPRFEADVARVSVGMENRTVAVPTIDVDKPANTQ